MKKLIIAILLIIGGAPACFSQSYIGKIFIERHQVFDSTDNKWLLIATFLNNLHSLTSEYIIRDELLFKEGDVILESKLAETERNIRSLGLFTNVEIQLDSVDEETYDIYVITRDKWSLQLNLLLGTGGGNENYGGRIAESNFFGTGASITGEALFRTENDIGWQGLLSFSKQRIFRTDYSFNGSLLAHRFRTTQNAEVTLPYITVHSPLSYGIKAHNDYGRYFVYNLDTFNIMPFYERTASAYFSRSWFETTRIFSSAFLELNSVDRGLPELRRAYDNSGKFLITFSSVAQKFFKVQNVNAYNVEDLVVGGWGRATLGKIFPIGHKGEGAYYVAAQGEQSYYTGNLYLFGQLTGSSGFRGSRGVNTYQEFLGLGFYKFTELFTLGARLRQQTVWNWEGKRQLILDNDSGLRGYASNSIIGDNRIIGNLELRFFPNWDLWIFKFGASAFWDIGAAWKQYYPLEKVRFHNSAGVGIRAFNKKSIGSESIFRFDFAYNFDENKLGGIIFTLDQFFSFHSSHNWKVPQIYGLEYDSE